MRAREFLMKDAYSFHLDEAGLSAEYQNMVDTYARIFTRLGLHFRAVQADSGAIGGSASQEFQVLADSGEDAIAFSSGMGAISALLLALLQIALAFLWFSRVHRFAIRSGLLARYSAESVN